MERRVPGALWQLQPTFVKKLRATNTKRVRESQAKSNYVIVLSRANCNSAFEEDPGPHRLWLNATIHQFEGKVVNRPFG